MIPKKVKIGAFTYKIELKDEVILDTKYGQCCHKTQRIFLLDDMTPERTKEVLIHEILHAIVFNFNIAYASGDEEHLVNGFGLGLAAVLRDNRKLREYLLDE